MKPKYEMTRTWFKLPRWSHPVKPFNGEKTKFWKANGAFGNDVSWSHGFTHFKDVTGRVGNCGVGYFEDKAVKIGSKLGV